MNKALFTLGVIASLTFLGQSSFAKEGTYTGGYTLQLDQYNGKWNGLVDLHEESTLGKKTYFVSGGMEGEIAKALNECDSKVGKFTVEESNNGVFNAPDMITDFKCDSSAK